MIHVLAPTVAAIEAAHFASALTDAFPAVEKESRIVDAILS